MRACVERFKPCRGSVGTGRRSHMGTVHAGSWEAGCARAQPPGPAPKEPGRPRAFDHPGSRAAQPPARHSGRSPAAWHTPRLRLSDRQEGGLLWPLVAMWRQCDATMLPRFGPAWDLLELRQAPRLRRYAAGLRPSARRPPTGGCGRLSRPHPPLVGLLAPCPSGSPARTPRSAFDGAQPPIGTAQSHAREGHSDPPRSPPLASQKWMATALWASLGVAPSPPVACDVSHLVDTSSDGEAFASA